MRISIAIPESSRDFWQPTRSILSTRKRRSGMGIFSILPEGFSTIETWLTRIFVLDLLHLAVPGYLLTTSQLALGLAIIGPWLLILVYDVLLYLWRSATYELPYVGGRARGKGRPRAPSLAERPDGSHRRKISVPGISRAVDDDADASGTQSHPASGGRRQTFTTVIEDDSG